MTTIISTYQGSLHCEAIHEPSGSTLATDAPKDNHGKGETFSPTDLMATALGTCILTLMGITARKLGINIEGAASRVEKTMSATPPRRIAKLTTTITMPAGNYTEEQKKALIHAANTCPVHQSLHPEIDAAITFVW
jgi:putative redox protein